MSLCPQNRPRESAGIPPQALRAPIHARSAKLSTAEQGDEAEAAEQGGAAGGEQGGEE